jgi:hypothetical protein
MNGAGNGEDAIEKCGDRDAAHRRVYRKDTRAGLKMYRAHTNPLCLPMSFRQDDRPGSFALPEEIGEQILDAAQYFAVVLKNCDPEAADVVPDWLGDAARRWIEGNAPAFSTLVLDAYERLRAEQLAARPVATAGRRAAAG